MLQTAHTMPTCHRATRFLPPPLDRLVSSQRSPASSIADDIVLGSWVFSYGEIAVRIEERNHGLRDTLFPRCVVRRPSGSSFRHDCEKSRNAFARRPRGGGGGGTSLVCSRFTDRTELERQSRESLDNDTNDMPLTKRRVRLPTRARITAFVSDRHVTIDNVTLAARC